MCQCEFQHVIFTCQKYHPPSPPEHQGSHRADASSSTTNLPILSGAYTPQSQHLSPIRLTKHQDIAQFGILCVTMSVAPRMQRSTTHTTDTVTGSTRPSACAEQSTPTMPSSSNASSNHIRNSSTTPILQSKACPPRTYISLPR